jgi:hypothetical protein
VKALRTEFLLVAQKLQEVADSGDVSHNDLCKWLSDACQEIAKPGEFCYFVDFFGDGESGDVVYSLNGDLMKAPYEVQGVTARIDVEGAVDVLPRTTYEPEADDDDHVASMESAKLYKGGVPLYERFIPKAARAAAPSGSFAGKGKSFPILKPEDVTAAVHAMGRAGAENYDAGTLKKNIIRIAKEKGWTSSLPKAWQGGGDDATGKEAVHETVKGLRLVESAATLEAIDLLEAAGKDYEIKLISPGAGATAYYPDAVLKRDGAKAFPAETKVYLNHPTKAQESEGPGNRDVARLAAVLTHPAEWKESHAKGPGLYARFKPFADHAAALSEKAKYLAMSIYAGGDQAVDASGRKVFRDGLPVLSALHEANPNQNRHSVDIVPIAGAGGLILTEAAGGAAIQTQEASMDADELKLLKESLATNTAITAGLQMKDGVVGRGGERGSVPVRGGHRTSAARNRHGCRFHRGHQGSRAARGGRQRSGRE